MHWHVSSGLVFSQFQGRTGVSRQKVLVKNEQTGGSILKLLWMFAKQTEGLAHCDFPHIRVKRVCYMLGHGYLVFRFFATIKCKNHSIKIVFLGNLTLFFCLH